MEEATKNVKSIKETVFINPTDKIEIENIIKNMKTGKAPGPDGIQNKILKDNKDKLSEVIANLINESINEGTFPENQKIAKIIPVYKGGEKK